MATANRGRKPAPPKLKVVNGRGRGRDGRARDSGGREVKPTPGFTRLPPEPPKSLTLTDSEREAWDLVVDELSRLELLKPLDAPALLALVTIYGKLIEARKRMPPSMLHKTSQGSSTHPYFHMLITASKELRAWCSEFGLTPAAENKLTVAGQADGADNPFT